MTKKKAIIVELDNVLANCDHRKYHLIPNLSHGFENLYYQDRHGDWFHKFNQSPWEPNYEDYYEAMDLDTVNESISYLLSSAVDFVLLYVTARPEKCREQTIEWLKTTDLWFPPASHLFMRPDFLESSVRDPFQSDGVCKTFCMRNPDNRPSHEVKRDLYMQHVKDQYEVLFVLESDQECCEMYKSLLLTVLQVK